MNIVLCGFKACGKTTVGKALAEELDWPFIDTDDLCVKMHQEHGGSATTCHELYEIDGEKAFRQLEHRVVRSLADVDYSIISTGGGTVLDPRNVHMLKEKGTVVYLEAEKENLYKDLFAGTLPEYFDKKSPEASFQKVYQERKPIYEAVADVTIHIANWNLEETLALIDEALFVAAR